MAKVYVAELTVYDPGIPGTTTLYYSTGIGFATGSGDTPADTFIDPRIEVVPSVTRATFGSGTTSGRSRIGFGDLVLTNRDGALDDFIDYGLDGRVITVRRGEEGAAYPSAFTTVLVGTMEQPEVTSQRVTVRIRDRMFETDIPLQATTFDGDNVLPDGLEGVAGDLKGKPKPVCYGVVRNVAPPIVNTSKLIFQVNDGAVDSVDAVYDRAVQLGQGTDYASEAEMLNDANEPDPGEFRAYPAGGYFRLGSSPAGLITCDATEGATAGDRTTAQIWTNMLTRAGFSSGDWEAGDVTALDTADASEIGYWTDDVVKLADALDKVASTPGAWWGADRAGKFRIKQFVAPTGSADAEIGATDLLRPLERRVSRDEGRGLPSYRTVLRYDHNPNVQKGDFTQVLTGTLAERPAFGESGRYYLATDAGPGSTPILYLDTGSAWVVASDPTAENPQDLDWLTPSGALILPNLVIDYNNSRIRLGNATTPTSGTGIFIGRHGGNDHFRAGNPAGDRIAWDGSNLTVQGGGTFSGSLSAASGTFSGSLSAATGTFAGDLSAAGGTFAGTLSAVDGTFTGTLSGVDGSFSGSLSAATGTFAGTVSGSSFTASEATFSNDLRCNGASTFIGDVDCNDLVATDITTGPLTCGNAEINGALNHDGSGVGFYGTAPVSKPTVSGARDDPEGALADLLSKLASTGLITNSTTAT